MKISLHRLRLPLKYPFTISRGTITDQPSLVVELEHDGHVGFGEVTENSFYGHTLESISQSLRQVESHLDKYVDSDPIEIWPKMFEWINGDTFALAALDMAAHDLRGRRLGFPTWQDWKLDWSGVPDSSYTIAIDTIDVMVKKLLEMADWSIFKIKLGTDRDLEIVRELRNHTDAIFRVDANCGWTADQTIEYSKQLAKWNVEFIEQPLPIEASDEDKRRVRENSILPIIADEDCQRLADVRRCHGLFDGVNVKLCKCGGLSPAIKMLRQAREFGMKTMVGCMVESPIGISGAAQLLPLLDYADLDGATLLREAPAIGVEIVNGKISQPTKPGCGAQLQNAY